MGDLLAFITASIEYAPGIVFVLILLAGLNIPISLDVLIIFSAYAAARLAPELTLAFYLSILFGSLLSAWICFSVGRFLGPHIERIPVLSWFVSRKKIESIGGFYAKYGLVALMIGRFIPFGVRNLIFLSKGMSEMSFWRFAKNDAIACFVWATTLFWTLYSICESFEQLVILVKKGNFVIFSLFGISLIGYFWYNYFVKKNVAHGD